MRVTVLGCGSSSGVPLIGCNCSVCRSDNPKNKRSRVSVFVEINGINLIVDTSPDLRQQALRQNIQRIDAVLYTHDHADHTHGIDDLRSFNYLSKKTLPVYGNRQSLDSIMGRFGYAFLPRPELVWSRPSLEARALAEAPAHEFNVEGVAVTAFEQGHGRVKTLGYRIGNFAYSTDADHLPETAFEALAGVEVWAVDCLKYSESHGHSHLKRTLEWIAHVKPKRAILTHMSHEMEYERLKSELPPCAEPGYDGLVIEMP